MVLATNEYETTRLRCFISSQRFCKFCPCPSASLLSMAMASSYSILVLFYSLLSTLLSGNWIEGSESLLKDLYPEILRDEAVARLQQLGKVLTLSFHLIGLLGEATPFLFHLWKKKWKMEKEILRSKVQVIFVWFVVSNFVFSSLYSIPVLFRTFANWDPSKFSFVFPHIFYLCFVLTFAYFICLDIGYKIVLSVIN